MDKYSLEERTIAFGENVIKLTKLAYKSSFLRPISTQLLRSGTSIGANYAEANGASSRQDFKNKIHICKKESIETKYWLRLLSTSDNNLSDKCRELWKEAQELTLIFSKILGTINNK